MADRYFGERQVQQPLIFLSKKTDALDETTGLRLAVAYTMPFMQATGNPGDRYGGAGDLSFLSTWTLLDATQGMMASLSYRKLSL